MPRAALILPVLLLGCAADRGADAAAMMEQALASARASAALSARPPAQPPPTTVQGVAFAAPGFAAPPRQRGTAPPAAAAALVGTRAAELRRMLGEPALLRPEGDAEIWLYAAPECRLDIVLYPEGGALAVAHAAARAHGTGAVTEAACLAAIATATGTQRRT